MPSARDDPIHVTVQGGAGDPRVRVTPPAGAVLHFAPKLHPDDVTVVDGLPVTSVARTLVDLAEVSTRDELVAAFSRARELGLLDMPAVEASYARVEWRPSRLLLRSVMDELSS